MPSGLLFYAGTGVTLLGLWLLVRGVKAFLRDRRMRTAGREARGKIVGHRRAGVKPRGSTEWRFLYFSKVQFVTERGETIEFEDSGVCGTTGPAETVHWESLGREVEVVYDPERPGDAHLKGESYDGVSSIVAGVIFVAVGASIAAAVVGPSAP